MTLSCTASLARSVDPLSTRAFYSLLVSLNAAIFRVWRMTRHTMLFVHLSSADLASHSVPLRTYDFFPNNQFSLASLPEPYSLTSTALSIFHIVSEQSFAFDYQKRIWTFTDSCIKELLYHWVICEPIKMCCSCCFISFWETKYHTPHVFYLAGYSTILHGSGQRPSSLVLLSCLSLRGQTQ